MNLLIRSEIIIKIRLVIANIYLYYKLVPYFIIFYFYFLCLKVYCINFFFFFLQQKCVKARALYDNIAEAPDELAFRKGDVLTVLEQNTAGLEGWWLCALRGRQVRI